MRELIYILTINLLFALLIFHYFKWIVAIISKSKVPLDWLQLKVAGKLRQLSDYLIKKSIRQPNPAYRSLTALANADSEDPYVKLLQDCVQDPDTRNIALTGPYGSGKSSILRSFQLSHPEYHYLNISLATFKNTSPEKPRHTPSEPDSDDEKKYDTVEQVNISTIEYSILQQLFYHVRHQQIPFSRFKRIKNLPVYIVAVRAISLILWLASIAYLIWHEKVLTTASAWDTYLKWPPNIWKLSLALIIFFGAIYLCYVLLRLYNNSKFHKFNLTSGEVEIAPASDASILNKHLDELLYFFEATKYNILVIEDLDRFDDPEIFVRLRELNNLLNYSRQVGRKISFIYALKDDVFKDEQRTKFFDYIVPVIPIIDHRNSAEKVGERLDALNIDREGIPQSFITDVSAYISDMRLLLNTVNEFELYRKKLNILPGSYTQLLAMMIFKNKFPKQFAQLHARKGVAYKVLSGKASFVSELSKVLLAEKSELEGKIQIVSSTFIRDKKELRLAYMARMIENINDFAGSFYTEQYSYQDVRTLSENDEEFEKLTKVNNLRYLRPNGNPASLHNNFSAFEKSFNPDRTYEQRIQDITLRQQNQRDELQIRLDGVIKKLDELAGLRLEDIFKIKPLQELKPELGKNQLLNYFVSSGYLNEDYFYYLSHFYPGSLSRRDFDFFFAIKENKQLPLQTPLDHTDELINRLSTADFIRPGILNINLADTILIAAPAEKLTKFISLVTNNSVRSMEFIHDYLRLGKQTDRFMSQLANWSRFWVWVDGDDQLTRETKRHYLGLLLRNATVENLAALNQQSRLNKTLEETSDFLSWSKGYISATKAKQILKALEVNFYIFDNEAPQEPLYDYVIKNWRYQLHPEMVEYIVKSFSTLENIEQRLRRRNLTTIREANIPDLMAYIIKYPGYYFEEVWKALPDNNQEDDEAIKFVLNNDELGVDRKRDFIQKNSIRLQSIADAPVDVWPDLLTASRIEANWTNVFHAYAKEKTLTFQLIEFMNQQENYEQIVENYLSEVSDVEEKDLKAFGEILLLSNALNLKAYDKLLSAIDFYYDEPNLEALSRDRVNFILNHDRLEFREKTFEFLQLKHSGLQLVYVENNLSSFFNLLTDLSLNALDYRLFLTSSKFTAEQQETLINHMDFSELENDAELPAALAALIVRPEFMEDLNHGALLSLFITLDDDDVKIRILTKYLTQLTETQTGSLLIHMQENFKELTNYRNPKFDLTPSNYALLKLLQDKRFFVNSLSENKGKIVAYTKQKPAR